MRITSRITLAASLLAILAGNCPAASDSILLVQLSMGRKIAPNAPPLKRQTAPPPKAGSGLTADERKRLATALSHLTPKQRKQLAKAVKHMTPDQRQQLTTSLKRQLAVRGTSSRAITRAR
jgi:hypothetical protein